MKFDPEGSLAMLRRSLALMIAVILWSSVLGCQPARAQARGATQAASTARAAVQKLGVGSQARVEAKLQDGTKLRGSVSSAGEDTFSITDPKTGSSRTVAYAEVARVKEPGRGFWARASVIALAAAVVTVIVFDDGAAY